MPLCTGIGRPTDACDPRTWQDFATYTEAEAAAALLTRQDARLLDHIVKIGVDGALRLIDEGRLDVRRLDHLLCHYSSHQFRSRIFDILEMCGAGVPYVKWFTNLYTTGNTGCASIMIMLDDSPREGRAAPGETVLCMVPESSRLRSANPRRRRCATCCAPGSSSSAGSRACRPCAVSISVRLDSTTIGPCC